jgi:hypothetical protein
MKKRSLRLLAASAAVLCAASAAHAGVLFSDLGTSGTIYNTSNNFAVVGTAYGAGATWANLFTVAGSGNLAVSQIDLALLYGNGGSFVASIWSDSSGVPGAQVGGASWSGTTTVSSCCALVSFQNISGVTLVGGQSYFLVVAAGIPLTTDYWVWNNQGATGTVASTTYGGSSWSANTATLSAFDVLGGSSAVPEPGTLLTLLVASAGLALSKRISRS